MKTLTTSRLACAAGTLAALCAGSVHAQTTATWRNPVSGNWSVGSNWTTDPVFPNNNGPNTFNAVISPTGSPYAVTLTEPIRIENITLSSPDAMLNLGGFDLTLNRDYAQSAGDVDSTGGRITVQGATTFSGGEIMGVRSFRANGALNFVVGDSEICDSDLNHNGSSCTWSGGNILLYGTSSLSFGASSTVTNSHNGSILWNNMGSRPVVNNAGTFIKSTGALTTAITDVTFNNTGTLDVRTGTFQTNGVTLAGGNTLTTGTWKVSGGSSIDLVGAAVTINRAKVILDGAASTFAAINGLTTNDTGAEFTVTNGKSFTTAANFTNNGRLTVGTSATFQVVAGSSLTNYNAGTRALSGQFDVTGMLKFDNTGIATLDGVITLNGTAARVQNNSGVDALTSLTRVSTTGKLSLKNSAVFTAGSNIKFEGNNSGTLEVEAGSEFNVPSGFTLDNYSAGTRTLSEGDFKIQGKLSFDNAGIEHLDSKLTLDGAAAQVVDNTNTASLAPLQSVDANGAFSLISGATFTANAANTGGFIFTVAGTGRVSIGETSQLDINGDLANYSGGTFTNGDFSVEGTLRARNIADVTTISTRIALSSATALITNFTNVDIFQAVQQITPSGSFTISAGRDLTLTSPTGLNIAGRLVVGPSSLTDATTVSVVHSVNLAASPSTAGNLVVQAASLNIGGDLNHVSGLAIVDNGTLSIAGAYNFSGGTLTLRNGVINADLGFNMTGGALTGDGFLNGDLVAGGVISPGVSAGRISVLGDITITPGAIVDIQLGGINPGVRLAGYDQLITNGSLVFDHGSAGTLRFTRALVNPDDPGSELFMPNPGDVFAVLLWHDRTGFFSDVEGLSLSADLFLEPIIRPDGLYVMAVQVPAPASLPVLGLSALCLRRRRR